MGSFVIEPSAVFSGHDLGDGSVALGRAANPGNTGQNIRCSRFRAQKMHLLQFGAADPLLKPLAVTALKWSIYLQVSSRFRAQTAPLLRSSTDRLLPWAVQHQLRKVRQVQATRRAFAAILADGSLVTPGLSRAWLSSATSAERLGL